MKGFVLSIALLAVSCGATALEPLHRGDYQEVLKQQPRPLLVVLWSVDCPPCYDELAALGRLHQEGMALPVVLVNTDTRRSSDEVTATLQQHNTDTLPNYQFADPIPARQRREIDPNWYGELPRSYLIEGESARGHSGTLTEQRLRDWLKTLPSHNRDSVRRF
ncbi:MAG: TlpA family protein disulfide reductase [Pseudomonadota bacterium]|nr:TlpA family protein disulfide reductase [Pseudomonadota bacterium]